MLHKPQTPNITRLHHLAQDNNQVKVNLTFSFFLHIRCFIPNDIQPINSLHLKIQHHDFITRQGNNLYLYKCHRFAWNKTAVNKDCTYFFWESLCHTDTIKRFRLSSSIMFLNKQTSSDEILSCNFHCSTVESQFSQNCHSETCIKVFHSGTLKEL